MTTKSKSSDTPSSSLFRILNMPSSRKPPSRSNSGKSTGSSSSALERILAGEQHSPKNTPVIKSMDEAEIISQAFQNAAQMAKIAHKRKKARGSKDRHVRRSKKDDASSSANGSSSSSHSRAMESISATSYMSDFANDAGW